MGGLFASCYSFFEAGQKRALGRVFYFIFFFYHLMQQTNSVQCTSVQLVALPILKEGDHTHLVVFDFFVSIHFQRNNTLSSSYATKLAQ